MEVTGFSKMLVKTYKSKGVIALNTTIQMLQLFFSLNFYSFSQLYGIRTPLKTVYSS
jgi:hypothetical protein